MAITFCIMYLTIMTLLTKKAQKNANNGADENDASAFCDFLHALVNDFGHLKLPYFF